MDSDCCLPGTGTGMGVGDGTTPVDGELAAFRRSLSAAPSRVGFARPRLH